MTWIEYIIGPRQSSLRLNHHKSKCMVIRRMTLDSNISFDILMNGEKIKFIDAARNLGLTFNANLIRTNHINICVGQAYRKLRCLWSTQYFTPLNIRRLIAKCHLLLGLVYGCELFASCDSVSTEKLNILFNNIVRYVYGLRRYDYVSRFSLKLYGILFDNLLSIRVLLLLHKIIYSESPWYLSDKIRYASSFRS